MKIYCETCKKPKEFYQVANHLLKPEEKGKKIYECSGLSCNETFEQIPTEEKEMAVCADRD